MKKKISLFLSIIMILNILSNFNIGKRYFGIVKAKASTSDVLDKSYNQLTEDDKEVLLDKYKISDSEIINGINTGLSLNKLAEVEGYKESFALDEEKANELSLFSNSKKNNAIGALESIKTHLISSQVSSRAKEEMVQLALQGYTGDKIRGSSVASEVIGSKVGDIICRDSNNELELSALENELTEADYFALNSIVTVTGIDALEFYNHCKSNKINMGQAAASIYENLGYDIESNYSSNGDTEFESDIPDNLLYAPYSLSNSINENIGLSRGDLSLNMPVYSLSGKGMDLNIGISYDSGRAKIRENIMKKYERYNYYTYEYTFNIYDNTDPKNKKLLCQRVVEARNSDEAERKVDVLLGAIRIVYGVNSVYAQYVGKDFGRGYYSTYYDDEFRNYTENERRNNIGMGWSLNFPYIKINPNDENNMTLVFPSGGEHGIEFGHLKGNGFSNYKKNDMVFKRNGGEFSNGQVESKYMLKYKDGTELFFSQDGRYLGTRDRYGNEIKINHTTINNTQVINKITDTVGRVITIDYLTSTNGSSIGGAKEVRMNLPDGNKIRYILEPVKGEHYKLVEIIDELNRETKFTYSGLLGIKESIDGKSLSNNNEVIRLNEVIYPTKAKTKYTYEKGSANNTNTGIIEFYRVKTREDIDTKTGKKNNIATYTYEGKHTDDNYKRKITDSKGIVTEYSFNNKNLIKNVLVKNGSKKVSEKINRYDNYDQLNSVENRIYDNYGSKYRTVKNITEYNSYGDLIKTIDERGLITTYKYDSTFHILEESEKFGVNGSVIIKNDIDRNNGNIKSTTIKHGSSIKSTTNYEYYTSGYQRNLLKREWSTADKAKQSEISYEYGNQYKGAYVTKTTVKSRSYYSNKALINTDAIIEYVYDFSSGLLKEEIKRSSTGDIRTKYTHDKIGRTTRIDNLSAGTYSTIGFDDANNIVTTSMQNGNITRTLYDSLGREERKQIYRDNSWVTLSTTVYNSIGEVDYVLDGNNNKTIFRYDKLGRVIETTLPNGAKTTNQYDAYENSVMSIDAVGRKAKEIKDISGNVIKTRVYPNKNNTSTYYETVNQYDKENNLSVVTDAKGYKTYHDYDVYGRLIKVRNNENRVMTVYDYDGRDNVIKINTLDGMTITKEYDELGRLMRETNSLNQSEYIGYNEEGQVRYKWDKAGNISTFIYDRMGRVINETHADGSISYGYNFSRGTSIDRKTITKDGNTSTFEYYKYGPLKKKTEGGKSISYTYDTMGNKKTIYDQSGRTTTYKYNNMSLIESVVVTGEGETSYTYYADEKVQWKKSSNDKVKEYFIYNDLGMVKEQRHYLKGKITRKYTYEYDKNGNKSTEIESGGGTTKVTTYAYDSLNRVDYIIEPDGTKIVYEYDGRSNIKVKKILDDNIEISKEVYEYDSMNKLYQKTKMNSFNMIEANVQETISYSRDNANLKLKIKLNSKDSNKYPLPSNAYDLLNISVEGISGTSIRKLSKYEFIIENINLDSLSTQRYLFAYKVKINETVINTKEIGRSAFIKDFKINITDHEGDAYHLKVTAKYKDGRNVPDSILSSVRWAWNSFQIGRLDKSFGVTNTLYVQTGGTLLKSYMDDNEMPSSLNGIGGIVLPPPGGGTTGPKTVDIIVSAFLGDLHTFKGVEVQVPGNPINPGFPIAMLTTNTFEYQADPLKTTTGSALEIETLTTTTGAALNVENLQVTTGSALKTENLITTTGSALNINIKDISLNDLKNNKFELTSIEQPKMMIESISTMSSSTNQNAVKYEYKYDGNGNLTSEYINGTLTKVYTYNTLNQLTSFQDKANNIKSSYTYYPTGLRKSKTVTGSPNAKLNGTITFHYSGDNVIMEEKGGNYLSRYTVGLSYIRRIDARNNKYYYLYDSHGDVTVITDAWGKVVKSYDYDIYGKEKDSSDGEAIYNPIRYTGQFFDEESGLYYLRARYYSPEIMRFISEDTYKGDISNPLTLNLYAYCGGNPVMMNDPRGHFWNLVIGGVVGGLVNAGANAVGQLLDGKSVKELDFKSIGVSLVTGAASGVLAATGVGLIGQVAGNAALSGIETGVNDFMEDGKIDDLGAIGESMLIGGTAGLISGPGIKHGSRRDITILKGIGKYGYKEVEKNVQYLFYKQITTKEFVKGMVKITGGVMFINNRDHITELWDKLFEIYNDNNIKKTEKVQNNFMIQEL